MESAAIAADKEWWSGWKPLTAGFVGMAVGWNAANVFTGLFIKPMQADLGWSRTELSIGPLASLIVSVLLPLSGLLMDRFGARPVAIFGVCALASAWALFAMLPARHEFFLVAVIWLGIAGSISNSIVFAGCVAPWFTRNLGLAIGLMMTGASVAAAVGLPLLSFIIAEHGWRAGFAVLAAVTLLALPLILIWFRGPARQSDVAEGLGGRRNSLRQIASTSAFWKLVMACAVAALPIGGFVGHLVPLMTDKGLAVTVAASLGSIFAIAVGSGRIANGALLDRLPPPLVTSGTLVLAAAGAALLAATARASFISPLLILAVAMIGLAQGAEGDYIKFFSMRLFGSANFPRVVALLAMTISLGMALGGIAFARVFDRYGSYQPALIASAALYVVGGLVFGSIRMRPPLVDAI